MGKKLFEYFEEVELEEDNKNYEGYFCRITDAIIITILGSMCGLKNIKQIQQWAKSEKNSEFLKEKFGIEHIPCYYWLLCLLKMIKAESLNKCIKCWAKDILSQIQDKLTISMDGKTVRSTEKMKKYENPLHIISAQVAELGLTFASKSVDGKSNEIPTVQELIKELEIKGCIVVADALNCQRETANIIVEKEADYLLSVKKNQSTLSEEISDYIQDDTLRKNMNFSFTTEKNRGRIEKRSAYTTTKIDWLYGKEKWKKLKCIGAIKNEFEENGVKSEEWHYYISSRPLTAEQLLHHARMEWSVETMHWLLDVHFSEDFCRVIDRNVQQNLNMLRKLSLSLLKRFKSNTNSKSPISGIMFSCLLDNSNILDIFDKISCFFEN